METKILRFPVGLEQARRAVWLLRYWKARSTADFVGDAEQALYQDAADTLAAILLPEQLAVVEQNMPSRLSP